MKITKIQISQIEDYNDVVFLITDILDPNCEEHNEISNQKEYLDLEFNCPEGTAEDFVEKHWPNVEIVFI